MSDGRTSTKNGSRRDLPKTQKLLALSQLWIRQAQPNLHRLGRIVLAQGGIRWGLVEGATENAAVVQALIDNLIERGLDPEGLPAVHRRWRQGAEQGHSSDLRGPHADPAVPDP